MWYLDRREVKPLAWSTPVSVLQVPWCPRPCVPLLPPVRRTLEVSMGTGGHRPSLAMTPVGGRAPEQEGRAPLVGCPAP